MVDLTCFYFWPGTRCQVLIAATIGSAMKLMVEVMQMTLSHLPLTI